MMMEMAKLSGRRPAEVAGIGCEFCAYCFDEACLSLTAYRENARTQRAIEAAERRADLEATRRRMMGSAS